MRTCSLSGISLVSMLQIGLKKDGTIKGYSVCVPVHCLAYLLSLCYG